MKRKVIAVETPQPPIMARAVVWYDPEWAEYKVQLRRMIDGEWKSQPAATYHTDDRNDAIATARAMVA